LLRMTIVPAVLHLIGERSWALPKALDKVLPHISVEGGDSSATTDAEPEFAASRH